MPFVHASFAELTSAVRGFEGHDRRRYVLLCLACAVLERADPQITLRLLGERLLSLAAEPDSDEARRTAVRHQLARQLLDDPAMGQLEEDRRQLEEYQALARAVAQFERRPRPPRCSRTCRGNAASPR